MARIARKLILDANSIFHITWQCHNHSYLMEHRWAKKLYYNLLLKYKSRYGVKIFSYCFMSSHPHLAGQCETQPQLSRFMQVVNTQFAIAINKFYKRTGQVVRDRFISPKIQNERHLWKIMTYIDLNPVRAKIVRDPKEYDFCSYGFYAYGDADPLLDELPCYKLLGATAAERQRNYRLMVAEFYDHSHCKILTHKLFVGDISWTRKKVNRLRRNMREMRYKSGGTHLRC